MDSEAFKIASHGSVGTITFCRPDSGNQLLAEDIRLLGKTARALGENPKTKVVVVKAEGESFCLGRKPGPGAPKPTSALAVRENVTKPILDLYADVRACPVPVIAVVQGEARGFGCALVGQCDLAIASENAEFSFPEMDINLPPTLAISAVLGKVPPKRLLQMVFSRRKIDAREALSLGLLSEVVSRTNLDGALQAMLDTMVDRHRSSLCAIKEYMANAPYMDPAGAARLGANLLSVVLSSPDEA